MAGVSPLEELTPRELFWMAEARAKDAWNRTASLMALVHNLTSKRPKSVADFHPLIAPRRRGGGMFAVAMSEFGAK